MYQLISISANNVFNGIMVSASSPLLGPQHPFPEWGRVYASASKRVTRGGYGDNRHNLPYISQKVWPGGWSIINSIIPPHHRNGKQNSFSFPTLHIINIITPPPQHKNGKQNSCSFPHTPSALDLISLSNGFSFKPTSSSSSILIDLVQCECVERWL